MLPSSRSRGVWAPLAHLAALAAKPIAAPVAWASGLPFRAMETDWGWGSDRELRKERDHLFQYSRQLEQELAEAREQFNQLKQVRAMLADTNVSLQHARVLAGLRDTQNPSLKIDVGADKGIKPGMIAANGYNLVGVVVSVGPSTADVRLLTAPGTHLNAIIAPPADGPPPRMLTASVEVAPRLDEGEVVFTAVVAASDTVEVGDYAHIADETWPRESRGFVIGRVMRITRADDKDNPLLRKKLVIKPMRSLPHLDTLVVAVPVESDAKR